MAAQRLTEGRVNRVPAPANSPVARVPEHRPCVLSTDLDSEDGLKASPSRMGAPAPLHPRGQTPPLGVAPPSIVTPQFRRQQPHPGPRRRSRWMPELLEPESSQAACRTILGPRI